MSTEPKGFSFLHTDCNCMSPNCSIRFSKDDECGIVWVEFQTYWEHSLWRRLKNAYHVLFNKKPKNWSELAVSPEDGRKIAMFLYSAIEDEEGRAEHGVHS